jgi:hypothetical protein
MTSQFKGYTTQQILSWVIHEEWQNPCMIADQHERDAEFAQWADLKPPGEAGPHRQQWHRRDNRDSDEGKRGSAPLCDVGRVERAQGVPERPPVACGLLADDEDDAARMHQQSRGDLEYPLAHA